MSRINDKSITIWFGLLKLIEVLKGLNYEILLELFFSW